MTVSAVQAGTEAMALRRRPYDPGRGATLAALLCGMGSVQIGASLAKLLFPVLGAPATAGLRVLLACLILLPVARLGHRGAPFSLPGRAATGALLVYGLTLGANNLTFYLALERLPLGVTVAIEFIGPLSLALIGSRRPLDLAWVGLAAGGLVLLLHPWQSAHRLDRVGVALAMAAGSAWAIYILAGRRLGRHVSGLTATALGMGIAAVATLPLSLGAAAPLLRHPHLVILALGMALLSSAVPYSIEMMAMRRMSIRGFSILMSLEPAIGALAGLVLLGEALSSMQWLAIGGIIAASLGSAATDSPPPAPATVP